MAKGISSYIDNLIGNTLRGYLTELFPLEHPFLSTYVDVFAMGLCLTLSFALALGVKESSIINNIFTTCNVCVVIFFIIAGSVTADFSNWSIPKENIPEAMNAGEGGFAPFGVSGIIHGAAICFYGFVGFDCIATTGKLKNKIDKLVAFLVTGRRISSRKDINPLSHKKFKKVNSLAVIFFSGFFPIFWPFFAIFRNFFLQL